MLRKATFEETAFLAIEFDQVADILGSNVLLPTCDFGGNKLQPLAIGSKIDVLTFSMIATSANSGAAVFVWHKQHDRACRAFVESLRKLPESEIPHALVRLAFSFCENSYFSPVWWSGLSSATKKTLEDRFLKGMRGHDNQSLVDDGVCAVNWSVTGFRELRKSEVIERSSS